MSATKMISSALYATLSVPLFIFALVSVIHLATTPNGCYAGLFVIGDPTSICQ